jgi:DeoR/GlpR family transcriptional regulator of sugar metabolism
MIRVAGFNEIHQIISDRDLEPQYRQMLDDRKVNYLLT